MVCVNDKNPKIPKVLWRELLHLFCFPIPDHHLKKQNTLVMFYAKVHLICVSLF